jgi:hypothetical protein
MNRWDITVKQSNYDFNPFRESDHGKYFKTITNIYEDWSKELEYANKQQYDFYWPSPVKPSGDHFDYEYENKLVEDWGIPKDFVIYRMWSATKKECPILCGLADKLGLEDAQVNIQTQTTGMMLHLHIDSLTGLRKERQDQSSTRATDPEWGRVFVMLEDWKPGHIIQFGNTYVPPWKAGDVVWFDWANIPHSTANTGPWPRTIAKITGKQTEKYKKLL